MSGIPTKAWEAIAEEFGTPCYVYDGSKIDEQCKALKALLNAEICYAIKACATKGILQKMILHGFGADVVSGGELSRAVSAGVKAKQIVFSGVGKQDWEIELALEKNIGAFNVESADELKRIQAIAAQRGKNAPVFLRVNPNISAKTNPYIATGLYSTKFGIAESQLEDVVKLARSLPNLILEGIGCHLGSQISEITVFEQAAARMVNLATALKSGHPEFTKLDMGGGLAVRYSQEAPPSVAEYARVMNRAAQAAGLNLVLEPGRFLVAEAGSLLTRVITVKTTPEKRFAVVDAAMNDLIRPSLYKAFHPIEPVHPRPGSSLDYDVVGPVCETGDFLALDRNLPPLEARDLLRIGICGAYAASMASNYNSRLRAPEVLWESGKAKLLRRRETQADLVFPEI